jgi:catechol 2,3-dioxygenase-like lactoylglutathione lyase family enzyme
LINNEKPPYSLRLAKPCLDVCISTNRVDGILPFWRDTIGLLPEDVLTIRDGLVQYRLAVARSIVKINSYSRPFEPVASSGYRELLIVRQGLNAPLALQDAEGNQVTLLPTDLFGVKQIAIRMSVRDLGVSTDFYTHSLGLSVVPDTHDVRVVIGESLLLLREDRTINVESAVVGPGFRFVTLQVFDVNNAYKHIVECGGRPGQPPRAVGTIAKYALVQDPDGNWIELSQRASLAGSLEEGLQSRFATQMPDPK